MRAWALAIMAGARSMPVRERAWGRKRGAQRPVPQPRSRMSPKLGEGKGELAGGGGVVAARRAAWRSSGPR